jgi:acetyl-CoA carboxylase carboxyl transferase subunit alpha
MEQGIVDEVIPEPLGGAHRDPRGASDLIKGVVIRLLDEFQAKPIDELVATRYEKYRKIGRVLEGGV